MLFGFNLNTDALIGLREMPTADYSVLRQHYRDAADEALAFAAVDMKHRYDKKHRRLTFDVGDYAYLRLHHGYRIQGEDSRKYSNQRAGPFKIKKKVGKLAYKLHLPPGAGLKFHPVVSVAQLEPAPRGPDPYNRPATEQPEFIDVANGPRLTEYVEAILSKRRSNRKLQYLVK
ncbi:unnamed protein product [Zymoseptoria tritici ST99CH_1A5]|uniref:Tf2-1-like SH3-like domain-containing protein n=1 Tax=Zymoseptoria tritici ST99CH_1A5 TaxID=1276529 RepID=A0A1Y6LRD6_ZYMTR|nr:unnamed protein product [Zymoseptoria tritici ST99CH_1A5]